MDEMTGLFPLISFPHKDENNGEKKACFYQYFRGKTLVKKYICR
jgi:hypothetical protein